MFQWNNMIFILCLIIFNFVLRHKAEQTNNKAGKHIKTYAVVYFTVASLPKKIVFQLVVSYQKFNLIYLFQKQSLFVRVKNSLIVSFNSNSIVDLDTPVERVSADLSKSNSKVKCRFDSDCGQNG